MMEFPGNGFGDFREAAYDHPTAKMAVMLRILSIKAMKSVKRKP